MKSKEEIKQLAFLKYPRVINDPYNPMEDDNSYERKIWIHGYTQCQEEDMARKEIQPEDIWNKESQDKIKEHILNHANNQSSEDIIETELAAKKYAEEDMANKKYTEEDMLKCWNTAFTDAMNIDSETYKPIFYSDFINSLNKQD